MNEVKMTEEKVQLTEREREFLREKSKKDLFFFTKAILGYTEGTGEFKALNKELHGDICSRLMSPSKRKLFLVPRGHLKTSLISISYVIWRIINNPDIRILLCSGKWDNAKKFLNSIKFHFEKNEIFRWLFSDLIPKRFEDTKWTNSEITVQRNHAFGEGTIETAGEETNIVSRHYNVIVKDDMVHSENIGTKEQLQKTIDWHLDSLNLLEPNGDDIVVGTIWHYFDLYNHIQTNQKNYEVYLRKAIENGVPIFPEKFSLEYLDETRKAEGPYRFSMQYMNEPVDDATATFKRSWLRYYKDEELPTGLYITTTVDPAISEKESADYSVVLTVGTDWLNNLYVLDIVRKQINPFELIKGIFDVKNKFNSKRVGIEVVAFQKVLKYFLTDEMSRRGDYFFIEELQVDSRQSKEMRIRGLVPKFEGGKIFIKEDMYELIDEYLRFPKCAHDDVLDALAHQLQIMRTGELPIKPLPSTGTFQSYFEKRKRIEKLREKIGSERIPESVFWQNGY